jgi:hypothetical protein
MDRTCVPRSIAFAMNEMLAGSPCAIAPGFPMAALRKVALFVPYLAFIVARGTLYAFWRKLRPSPDQKLEVSTHTISELSELRIREKYKGVVDTIYNGMRPESSRVQAEAQLNGLIDRLRDNLPLKPSKRYVLAEFTVTMAEFRGIDTEDREQLLRYLEEIMDILGIESSDGLLNRWLYGPILGSNLEQQHKKL